MWQSRQLDRKFLDERIGLRSRIENLERGHAGGCGDRIIRHGVDAEAGRQIGLLAKGIENVGNRAGIRGLHAGHHALDMVIVIRCRPGMTVAAAAGLLYD